MPKFKSLLASLLILFTGCNKSEDGVTGNTSPVDEAAEAGSSGKPDSSNLSTIDKNDIEQIKAALITAMSEQIILEHHADIAKARGFNQFEKEDFISQRNLSQSMKFLGEFAREKNLYDPSAITPQIIIDTRTNSIQSNITLYQVVINEMSLGVNRDNNKPGIIEL